MTLTRALVGALLVAVLMLHPVERLERWRSERAAAHYYAAWATGDREGVCARLSKRRREALARQVGGRCEAARIGSSGADPRAADDADRSSHVTGGRARVAIAGVGSFSLVREGGAWRVDGWGR